MSEWRQATFELRKVSKIAWEKTLIPVENIHSITECGTLCVKKKTTGKFCFAFKWMGECFVSEAFLPSTSSENFEEVYMDNNIGKLFSLNAGRSL